MTLLEKWRAEVRTNLPELLKEVATSIKSVHPNSTVILFGSFARGEQNDDSDLDICVLVPELTYGRVNMRVDARCAIRHDFPLPMDVLLYTYGEFEESAKIRSRMQHKIKNEGVVLNDPVRKMESGSKSKFTRTPKRSSDLNQKYTS